MLTKQAFLARELMLIR